MSNTREKSADQTTGVPELFQGYLGIQNLKLTRERRLILDTVTRLGGHFGAEELFVALSDTPGKNARPSRATVYRTLEHLVASGIVQKVFLSDHDQRKALYEQVHGKEHHEHMHCLKCGSIIEFTDHPLEERQKFVCRQLGFKPVRHSLRIEGLCKSCQDPSSEQAPDGASRQNSENISGELSAKVLNDPMKATQTRPGLHNSKGAARK
jgi:Fur family ferric uptake transcriptional regulator